MKLVRFPQGDNEVLIDPEKVSHIEKRKRVSSGYHPEDPIIYVLFGGANEWVEFTGKDAEIVWHYFYNYGLAKPATLD